MLANFYDLLDDTSKTSSNSLEMFKLLETEVAIDDCKQSLIEHMRQKGIVGSVGPLHGPIRQRSHASADQPDRPEGEDPAAERHANVLCEANRYRFSELRQM